MAADVSSEPGPPQPSEYIPARLASVVSFLSAGIPDKEIMAHFQMITFSAGTYFAFPTPTFVATFVVFNGVGIRSTTLLALSFGSKAARRWIVYSTRDFVGSVTCVCRRKGRLMLVVERYLRSANALTRHH